MLTKRLLSIWIDCLPLEIEIKKIFLQDSYTCVADRLVTRDASRRPPFQPCRVDSREHFLS